MSSNTVLKAINNYHGRIAHKVTCLSEEYLQLIVAGEGENIFFII